MSHIHNADYKDGLGRDDEPEPPKKHMAAIDIASLPSSAYPGKVRAAIKHGLIPIFDNGKCVGGIVDEETFKRILCTRLLKHFVSNPRLIDELRLRLETETPMVDI